MGHSKRSWIPLCAVLLVAAPCIGGEDRTPLLRDIEIGSRQIQRLSFEAARVTLEGVVARLEPVAAERDADLARACLYLGAAYAGLGREDLAVARFSQARRWDPSLVPPVELGARVAALFNGEATPVGASSAAASPTPVSGRLQLGVKPWAVVFLDGRELGQTPLAPLSLGVGSYKIRFVNPAYAPLELEVRVDGGMTTKATVDLRAGGAVTEQSKTPTEQ